MTNWRSIRVGHRRTEALPYVRGCSSRSQIIIMEGQTAAKVWDFSGSPHVKIRTSDDAIMSVAACVLHTPPENERKFVISDDD